MKTKTEEFKKQVNKKQVEKTINQLKSLTDPIFDILRSKENKDKCSLFLIASVRGEEKTGMLGGLYGDDDLVEASLMEAFTENSDMKDLVERCLSKMNNQNETK